MYTDRCCRVQPSDWLCRCSYSLGDIPGLPDSSFVKQCDSHFAEELVGDRDNLLPLQCHNMETDQSTVPRVCPRHHEEFFGPTGNLGAFADDVRYNCDDALKLLHSVVSPDNASLPHFRLINDAIRHLKQAPKELNGVQDTVVKVRDVAMREYLGFWFYYQLWSPDEIPEMKVEIDLLFQRVKNGRDHNLPGAPIHQNVLEHLNEQETEQLEIERLEREIEEIESSKSVTDSTPLVHPRK